MVLDLPLVDWRERFNGCQVIRVLLLLSRVVVVCSCYSEQIAYTLSGSCYGNSRMTHIHSSNVSIGDCW